MFKCTTKRYDKLYSRWLRSPGDLLDLGGYDPAKDRLLDLCGGTGAVALEAVRRGAAARVALVDLNPRCVHPRIQPFKADVCRQRLEVGLFDLCVIRQAVGYLDMHAVASSLSGTMPPGSRLVFNTFRNPRWRATVYRDQGRSYLELSGHFGSRVVHAQVSPSVGVDISAFRYQGEEELLTDMCPWFLVRRIERTTRSARYLMIRTDFDWSAS